MRVVVVYRKESEHYRAVQQFLNELFRRTGKRLEEMDPDSREGADFCRTYDVVEYPTIIALSSEGSILSQWRGATLPTISEVSYYAMD